LFGGGEADELAARGKLGSDLRSLVASGRIELVRGFVTDALAVEGETLTLTGTTATGTRTIDRIHNVAAATGFRPDLTMLSELRLDLDPGLEAPSKLAPLIDPQFHSCGTVPPHGHRDLAQPEPGFYIVGMKSYGRAPTFLITTGNEQVRSIAAALAGDLESADAVELVLPETGVCSTNLPLTDDDSGSACCGTPAATPVDEIAAVLTSPVASLVAWHVAAGTGLSTSTVRVAPAVLASVPWPAGDLEAAVAALISGDVPECGRRVALAYGVPADEADGMLAWWRSRLPRPA